MKKITLLAFLLVAPFMHSQRNLTLQEATYGAYTSFAPQNLVSTQWKDAQSFSYLDATYQNLMVRSLDNQWAESTLVKKSDLEQALQKKYANDTFNLSIFPYDYTWKDAQTLSFNVTTKKNKYIVLYDVAKQDISSAILLDIKATNETLSNTHQYVAWLNENNIRISDRKGTTIEVTHDADKGIVNGSDYTHRQEFGINKGMWFSADGTQLLYYRKDETMVTDYPLPDFSTRIAEVKNIKYPMAGMKSEEVTLVVYNLSTQKKLTLQTGEPKEQFLTSVTWDPSGKFVYVGVLNREQNHLKMNKYSAEDGKRVATLFEEKSDKYVEPQNPLYFNPSNAQEFIYLSDKDGYRQMYVYHTSGKLLKKLGYQNVVVKELIGFQGNKIYYTGTANQGLDIQLYEVDIKKAKTQVLTKVSGVHAIEMNADKSYFLDSYSNTTTPREINLTAVAQSKSQSIISASNPYEGKITLPKMELVSIKAADGKTDLNGRLIYPSSFDPSKKYPVMVYVYGGPHAQLVTNSWLGGASLFDYYMAQQGFVVFTLDNRGSDNRGRDFEQVIHRSLGQNEMADQMKGIAFLQSKSFVDQDRIGVYGWSFGGFMTTSLMLTHPEVFKVGVAGGPVMDWKWYEIMYGERYMDTPQENPDGYALTSTIDKAKNLKGRLLIIHGAQDPVVVQQHSMEFIEACIKAGKQVDYFLYPTHEHNVSGRDRVHLNEKIADYFITHLKK